MGIYHILSVLPIWATALIFLVLLEVIPAGRWLLEAKWYDVALSSKYGDKALLLVVLIAARIIQRGDVYTPSRLSQDGEVQLSILLMSFILGLIVCVFTIQSRSGKAMDVYHDVIVAPLFLFFAITLIPVVYLNGTRWETMAAGCAIGVWIWLVKFDIKSDRLNQRRWLERHGVNLWRMRNGKERAFFPED